MLGIFLIYWIAKRYYSLAHDYERTPWLYGLLGIVVYYGSQLIFGVLYYVFFPEEADNLTSNTDLGLTIAGIIFGIIAWWGVYELIKNSWQKKQFLTYEEVGEDDIESIGKGL